jgi:hypothetical protein
MLNLQTLTTTTILREATTQTTNKKASGPMMFNFFEPFFTQDPFRSYQEMYINLLNFKIFFIDIMTILLCIKLNYILQYQN